MGAGGGVSEVKFMLCPHDDSWKGIKGHDYPVQVALKLRYPKVCFFSGSILAQFWAAAPES